MWNAYYTAAILFFTIGGCLLIAGGLTYGLANCTSSDDKDCKGLIATNVMKPLVESNICCEYSGSSCSIPGCFQAEALMQILPLTTSPPQTCLLTLSSATNTEENANLTATQFENKTWFLERDPSSSAICKFTQNDYKDRKAGLIILYVSAIMIGVGFFFLLISLCSFYCPYRCKFERVVPLQEI